MNEIVDQIPPEAWPLINIAFWVTAVITVVWWSIAVFVYLRRSASNLTPVQAARRKKSDTPDFLSVDHKARDAALDRADDFERELSKQEAAEAREAARKERDPWSVAGTAARLMSLFMSLFTLATMIAGSIFQVTRMRDMVDRENLLGTIGEIIVEHPIGFTIASLVILYHIWRFFADRKWNPRT
ncbi:MAG: hypothetical protein AAF638_04285 [Pseudomonadota bacterium]